MCLFDNEQIKNALNYFEQAKEFAPKIIKHIKEKLIVIRIKRI